MDRKKDCIFKEQLIITLADMKALSELPTHGNENCFASAMPTGTLPFLYYRGDGDTMVLAVPEQEMPL